jgi:predicted dehydrogenase
MRIAVLSFAHGHAVGYLRRLAAVPDVEVVGADPDARDGEPGRGAALAAELGIRYAPDYATALAEHPDAVVVCAENTRHRELVELAAAAGPAVILCEKPLATTAADAQAMAEAAERAGASLMVAYPVRFSAAFRALRERVTSGALGAVLGIVGTNNGKLPIDRDWFTDPALSGGGALVDHVVHCADLIDALLPQRPVAVHAVANRILHPEVTSGVETGGIVTIEYEDGIVATIDCSWSQPESASSWGGLGLEVTGERGSLRIAPFAAHVGGFDEAGAAWIPYGEDLDGAMLDEFLDAVRTGRRPQPDAASGVRTAAIMAAAATSARAGVVVGVDLAQY